MDVPFFCGHLWKIYGFVLFGFYSDRIYIIIYIYIYIHIMVCVVFVVLYYDICLGMYGK